MAKIDLEKLICSLAERNIFLRDALKEQGLEYKDGEIVEIQEPKFKLGDWISGYYTNYKVTAINSKGYVVEHTDGSKINILFENEKFHHLFTIADAKNGDVLVNGSNIFIFHFLNDTRLMGYCHVNIDNGIFYVDLGKNECFCLIDAVVTPATNAQRALLFQKMKEAGYKWDADKKKLKKIDSRFDYEHANIQQKDFAPKASTANRQLYNRAILAILSNYVEKYPDIRFGQMLCNLGIGPVFNEESQEIYLNLNENLKKKS